MATDPYGFPEAGSSAGSASDAVTALWAAMAALICAALGPCLCYLPWLAALPLSGVALWYGSRARNAADARGNGYESAANAALVGGGVGLVLSLMFLALAAMYVIYMVAIVGLAASGALD